MRTKLLKSLLTIACLLCSIGVYAHDFEVDGIFYNYYYGWNGENEVSVTYKGSSYDSFSNEYTGSVIIPDSVTFNGITYKVVSISGYAFYYCTGLKSVTIPESIISIDYHAFEGCSGLTSITIPESVTSIGLEAFYKCTGLTSITIPESVTSIGQYALSGCTGLTSITISEGVTSIDKYAFYGCTGLTSLTIPESVTSIGERTFCNCTGLTSVKVEEGNTVFDSRDNCNALIHTATNTLVTGCQNTVIPNTVTSIDEYAFYGCTGLTSITIPESVTAIGQYVFYGCDGLTSITISEGVTSISDYTFYNCTGLTSITIPEGVTSIGNSTFRGCTGLTSITIPESVTLIGNSTFRGCTGLTSINISEGITSIGSYVFEGCTGLTSITIPEGVTSIGSHAFYNCKGLTLLTIPQSVTSIGDCAFDGCTGLTEMRVYAAIPPVVGERGWGSTTYYTAVNRSIPVYVPKGSGEAYKSAIGWSEFTNIIEEGSTEPLPESTRIYVDGIYYQVTSSADKTVGVTYKGVYSSSYNEYGGAVVIPESITYHGITYRVTSIGIGAFSGCIGLTSVTVPESVTSIGQYAFSGCTGLTTITIPEGVTSIGEGTFYNCTGLTSVTIPEGVTSVGQYAFENCTGLTSITIPEGVTMIGEYAFSGCTGLKVMDVKATTPPTITYNTFEGVDKSIPVYVPAESGEAYRTASNWREFTNIIADNHLCAESVQALKLNGVLQLNELTLPVSMINDVSVLGMQCDIELPDGLTAVAKDSGYDITLSERAANYSVSAKLREDGLLRVLIYPNNTTNPITGNEGELFTIKLMPKEQYDSNDKIILRNIELTITQFNTLYARDFSVDCTIKESILGDSNRDLKVNVTDLSQMALYVKATEGVEIDTDGADADRNGVVESNDIDSVGNMVVAGSADATQNVTTPDAESPNYLQAEDMGIIILDGALLTQSAVLPIALTNTTPMMGVQCDVAIPAGLTLLEDEAGVVITPSERLGEGHVIKSAWLSTDSLRVLIYSPTATAISGTSGTLFSLQLQVAESYEPQTTLTVTNITIASQDAQEYNAKALNVSCTITESITGDCNRDGRVNVSDLVIIIYNILGVDTGDSNMIAADVNQDGELNVTDVVELVAMILDGDNEPRKAPAQEDYETGTLALVDTQIVQGTTHEVGIELSNTAPYTAFQMDVTLPECLTLEDVVVSNRTNNHSLQWREQADGTIRIVGYSLSNEAIGGEGGTLLNLVVRADNQLSEGVVEINGITFVTRDIVTHQLDRATGKVCVVTGLNDVVTATRIYAADHKVVVDSPVAQEAAISTIDGVVQRVALQAGRNEIPLQQGVYIVAVDAEVKKVVIR